MARGPHIATQWKLPASPYAKAASTEAIMGREGASARPSCRHCAAPCEGDYCCNGCRRASELHGALSVVPEAASSWLTCDLQGLHCAACVTVIEATFRAQPGAREITIN